MDSGDVNQEVGRAGGGSDFGAGHTQSGDPLRLVFNLREGKYSQTSFSAALRHRSTRGFPCNNLADNISLFLGLLFELFLLTSILLKERRNTHLATHAQLSPATKLL